MLIPRARGTRSGQWSLVGTLISVAILIALAAFYLPHLLKPAGPNAQESSAIQQANGAACGVYLSQLNAATQSYKIDHDGQPPRSLDDLKKYGVTNEMLNSPGCAFQMDSATGGVTNAPARPPGAAPQTLNGPQTLGGPAPATGPPPPPNGGTRGPGGITIPNIPNAGAGL